MNLLLRWLVTHFLFCGTLFAAGDVALGGGDAAGGIGASGGAEGDLGDGAGAGDGAVLADDAAEGAAVDGVEKVAAADGAKPSTHRAILESFTKSEEFKALTPEVQKSLTRLQQSLRTISEALAPVGGLKNAQEIAKVLSSVGGVEAITDMQSRLAEIDDIDAKLASGDPGYVEDLASNMPEEFAAMMPHAVEKWAALQPESFLQMVAANVSPNLFSDDPEKPGVANLASRAYDLISNGKPEDAQKYLQAIYKWCKAVKQQASTKPAAAAAKPGGDKNAASAKETQAFDRIVTMQSESYSKPRMEAEIKRQFGGRALDKETLEDMMEGVTREMTARAAKDKEFQRQIALARSKRDEKRTVTLANSFDDRNLTDAVKTIYGRRYRGMNLGQKMPVKMTPQNPNLKPNVANGVTSIVKKPADGEMVLNSNQLNEFQRKLMAARGFKTIQQAIMANVGFTRSGKVVQWQKD